MNQQRSRRFRSAQERQEKDEQIEKLLDEFRQQDRPVPELKRLHAASCCCT